MKYDSTLYQTDTYEITDLKDLNIQSDSKGSLDAFLKALHAQIPDSSITTDFAPPPNGTLGSLVPRTKLVVKLPKFAWGLFQTVATGIWMTQQQNDPLNMTVGGGLAFVDGVQRIKDSFYFLKEHQGEYCIYLAAMQAADYGFMYHLQTADIQTIWQTHQKLQTNCTENKCQYYKDDCTMQKQTFEQILETLISHKLLFKKGGKIGIKL